MRQLPGKKTTELVMSGYGSPLTGTSQFAVRIVLLLSLVPGVSGCGNDKPPQPKPQKTVERTSPPGKARTPDTTKRFENREQPENTDGSPKSAQITPPLPEPAIFRPGYQRTEHDPDRLATFGLNRFSTKHLELITDLPREQAEPLVPLVDALQPFLETYFGKLPPARDGSEYRISGFVMEDRNRFVQARLAKAELLDSFHGRQIGAEFWMNNQTLDYYRRHLLLHEAVHCYMRHLPGEDGFPMWYLEGMAEMIATHHRRIDDPETGTPPAEPQPDYTFNVMPVDRNRFRGLERIVILQRDVKKNGVQSIAQVRSFTGDDFKDSVVPYAWCWALCRFLDSHPKTAGPFRKLARRFLSAHPGKAIDKFFWDADPNLETDWTSFIANIEHGYEYEANAIVFGGGVALDPDLLAMSEISANRGWQSSQVRIEAGNSYHVKAAGQVILAQDIRPWISEANGVSIRYHNGQPLGRLLGAVFVEGEPQSLLQIIPLGNSTSFTAQKSGTIYLKVNDWPHSLSDNQGKLDVSISNFLLKRPRPNL